MVGMNLEWKKKRDWYSTPIMVKKHGECDCVCGRVCARVFVSPFTPLITSFPPFTSPAARHAIKATI